MDQPRLLPSLRSSQWVFNSALRIDEVLAKSIALSRGDCLIDVDATTISRRSPPLAAGRVNLLRYLCLFLSGSFATVKVTDLRLLGRGGARQGDLGANESHEDSSRSGISEPDEESDHGQDGDQNDEGHQQQDANQFLDEPYWPGYDTINVVYGSSESFHLVESAGSFGLFELQNVPQFHYVPGQRLETIPELPEPTPEPYSSSSYKPASVTKVVSSAESTWSSSSEQFSVKDTNFRTVPAGNHRPEAVSRHSGCLSPRFNVQVKRNLMDFYNAFVRDTDADDPDPYAHIIHPRPRRPIPRALCSFPHTPSPDPCLAPPAHLLAHVAAQRSSEWEIGLPQLPFPGHEMVREGGKRNCGLFRPGLDAIILPKLSVPRVCGEFVVPKTPKPDMEAEEGKAEEGAKDGEGRVRK